MGKILKFKARRPPAEEAGFAEIEVLIYEDGTFSIKRNGDTTMRAVEKLAEAIGIMQMKIIHDARASDLDRIV